MSLPNKTMYSILGILNIAPCSGYDIKKYNETVLAEYWHENYGHIYPTIKVLTEQKMIEPVLEESGGKKNVYRITQKGKDELNKWLSEDTQMQPIRSEFMLKLMFSGNRPKKDIISMLTEYRTVFEVKVARYQAMQKNMASNPDISRERAVFMNVGLRRGILSDNAVIEWCNEVISVIERM